MATVPVVGFDLGFLNSYVAVARAGGIETVANEYSDRCTSSCVSFTDTMRYLGNSAKQRIITNMNNTVHNFTKLIGKSYEDPVVQAELPYAPYKLVKLENGGVGVRVSYLCEERLFSAEQLVAMLLTKLKSVAELNLSVPVIDCVINCPTYYDDRERRALLDASRVAGLNCLRLLNDITAIGLCYGICHKQLPQADQQPMIVAFVDMGHSHLQCGLVAFNRGRMRVLATACDSALGGRDFDRILFNHFVEEFNDRLNVDVRSSQRAQLKLMEECNRVKKLMSANSTEIPLAIECLVGDRDVAGRINRAAFRQLLDSAGLLKRIEDCLRQCLSRAGIDAGDVADVEIVGGSTRVPVVKEIVADVFGQSVRTTLNADEAVARGCSLMCAMLSPACRVREFSVADSQSYSLSLCRQTFNDMSDRISDGVEVFPLGQEFPCEREIDLPDCQLPFNAIARYTMRHDVPHTDRIIGRYIIGEANGVEGGVGGQTVRLRARIDSHGVFGLVSATRLPTAGEKGGEGEGGGAESQADSAEYKKRRTSEKSVDLPIRELDVWQLPSQRLADYQEQESKMVLEESRERQRSDARNTLEEFVYACRNRLDDAGVSEFLVNDDSTSTLRRRLDETESWLYGEGEAAQKSEFVDRLDSLRSLSAESLGRAEEAASLTATVRRLGESLTLWRRGEGEFAGAGQSEAARLSAKAESASRLTTSASAKELQEQRRRLEEAAEQLRRAATTARAKEKEEGRRTLNGETLTNGETPMETD